MAFRIDNFYPICTTSVEKGLLEITDILGRTFQTSLGYDVNLPEDSTPNKYDVYFWQKHRGFYYCIGRDSTFYIMQRRGVNFELVFSNRVQLESFLIQEHEYIQVGHLRRAGGVYALMLDTENKLMMHAVKPDLSLLEKGTFILSEPFLGIFDTVASLSEASKYTKKTEFMFFHGKFSEPKVLKNI